MNIVERSRSADALDECPPLVQGWLVERRRSERVDEVSPHLLPLLRGPGSAAASPADLADEDHFGTPMLGILVAVAISIPLWCAVILAVEAIVG